ncbi:MAG: ion channel [Myxococcota bacterium]
MSPLGRLSLALGGLTAITLVGTLGYRWVEGWPWLDALYMTVITLSTVGYREAAPLSAEGKLFTVALIVVGVAKQPALEAAGLPYLILSATTDEALGRAGIQRAKAALKRGSDPIRIAPDKQTRVEEGDHLVVIGDREHLDQLARRAEGADA